MTYYRPASAGKAEDVSFFYHPCVHPWLKLQLALLAVSVAQRSLTPDSSLTQDRPLMLAAWGVALEMAWVEPAWAVYWLKRQWKKQKKKFWSRSDSLSLPSPLAPVLGRGRPCWRGCVQAQALAFTLRSWRPPGADVASSGLVQQPFPSGAKRRGLRAAFVLQPTPSSALRGLSASPWSLEARQPTVESQGTSGAGRASTGGPLQTVRTLWLLC